MQGVKSKTMKSASDLTKDEILLIWTMRAGKNSNQDIAKKIGCQPWVASDVITKGVGPSVPIPAEIKKAALQTIHPRKRGLHRNKPLPVVEPGMTLQVALPAFTFACIEFERTFKDCVALGMTEDNLKLIAMSIRDTENQVKKS